MFAMGDPGFLRGDANPKDRVRDSKDSATRPMVPQIGGGLPLGNTGQAFSTPISFPLTESTTDGPFR